YESAFDQRDERRHSESSGCQGAGDRQADGDIRLEHLLREQLAGFAQPRGVVGEIGPFDEIGDRFLAVDAARVDALPLQKPAGLVRGVLLPALLPLFSGGLLLRLGARCGCLAMPRCFESTAISAGIPLPPSLFPLPVTLSHFPSVHPTFQCPLTAGARRTDHRRFSRATCKRL